MSDEISETYRRNVERPADLVRIGLRMILGAGLIIALILKVYMMVMTDYVCVEGEASLGALIRCTGTLDMMGYTLAIAAGIEVAAGLFFRSRNSLLEALVIALGAAVILAISRDLAGDAGWRASLSIATLVASLIGLRVFWEARK